MSNTNVMTPYTKMKQLTDRDARQFGPLVADQEVQISTANQQIINLTQIVCNLDYKSSVQVYVDGKLLTEGAANDYTWTNVQSNLSSQITLAAPIQAALNIQVIRIGVTKQDLPNAQSVQATLLNDVGQPSAMARAGFQSFVQRSYITAPATQIVNRAQVEAGSLKGIFGVERIAFKDISALNTEFGANGEPVSELVNKDSRVRFVGQWAKVSSAGGTRLTTGIAGDYLEITFYGTGINLMTYSDTANKDLRVSVDGGAEGANITVVSSNVIYTRNYTPNNIFVATSGLTAGWHTVKIRDAGTSRPDIYGIEIVNQRTNLAVLAGTAFGGTKQEILSALSTTSLSAGVSGVRGARVVKYIQNGVISQAVQEVNAAQANLTSADHTNEEVLRKINFREFGVNRADDFSTMGATVDNRAFTLDDGTTTLVSNQNQAPASSIRLLNDAASNIRITFIGTGLDMVWFGDAAGTNSNANAYAIVVDGTFIGNWDQTVAASDVNMPKVKKLVSGLPYGTHTVIIGRNTANIWTLNITDFLVYGPKKPTLPSGAVELVDYNLMATYVANNTSGVDRLATGIMRKFCTREMLYTGSATWVMNTLTPGSYAGGFEVLQNSSAIGNRVTYTFFGTGFEWRQLANGNTGTLQFALNGTNLTSSNFATATLSSYGFTNAYNTSTGIQDQVAGVQDFAGVRCSNLPLALYTLTVTTTNSSQMRVSCIDVISPIHINNTKVGSLSLKDSRAFSPLIDKPEKIDLSKVKAWIYFDATNSKILSSYNIASVLSVTTGQWLIYLEKPFKDANFACVASSGLVDVTVGNSTGYRGTNFQRIETTNTAGTFGNNVINAIFVGEQEDEGEI